MAGIIKFSNSEIDMNELIILTSLPGKHTVTIIFRKKIEKEDL